jgi:hypothetical protein
VDDRSLQEKRKGRSHEDVYFMAQFYQLVGQVGQINALAAAVRISSITQ